MTVSPQYAAAVFLLMAFGFLQFAEVTSFSLTSRQGITGSSQHAQKSGYAPAVTGLSRTDAGLPLHILVARQYSSRLLAETNDDDNKEPKDTKKNITDPLMNFLSSIPIPNPLVKALIMMNTFFHQAKWYVATFSAGAVLAIGALLVPLYDSVQTVSQPVALFETILADLDQAYVDPIDSYKLFETGVTAMLNSLDPYTEFENIQEAAEMSESIEGKYGGVGLVISGLPQKNQLSDVGIDEDDQDSKIMKNLQKKGVRVVSAFEGYAFDYGMRVGDKLVAIDNFPINDDTTVEQVRNKLRGEPGTLVTISFERDGVNGLQTVTMPRTVVRVRDVKLATLLGNPADGLGYIQLSGFTSDAGREMRNAITYLQRAADEASRGERSLQGLVLDLRGNPGGLLTSAVDVASLMVPKGSDIVSARGRGFPSLVYRSRVEPILDTSKTKLAVLVNSNTASAAEIVSGAVQDLDVGIIVGADRTFGKGLVQNVEELPFNTALKFTVAKYYTPSGRCIQGVTYTGGDKSNSKYVAAKVDEKDKTSFYTRTGRVVRDGGGIEADYKVPGTKASALEVTLLRSGVLSDFAAEWSKKHQLTNNFSVDEDTYKDFQAYVNEKQKSGELQLEALYGEPLKDLKKALKASGYVGAEKSVEQLQTRIVHDIQSDFERYRQEIKEDLSQTILSRYLPESMLLEQGIRKDPQVQAALKLLGSRNNFDKLLAKGSAKDRGEVEISLNVAMDKPMDKEKEEQGFRTSIKW